LFVAFLFRSRASLAAENLVLRQQLNVLRRSVKRPKLRAADRIFWVCLFRIYPDWRSWLMIVKPETVIKWHRQGFRLFWRRKSRSGTRGRPQIPNGVRELIRRMSIENPMWGAPRIHDELHYLGIEIARTTVAKYMVHHHDRDRRRQTWRTFLRNHADGIADMDFFVVPTITFRLLYCFVVLRHDRRRVAHFNVTEYPTAQWTSQQIVEAFPFDDKPRFLISDRDGIYGSQLERRIEILGIRWVRTAPRSPWQNGYAERLIGSVRRECLDHVIVLNEHHLFRILSEYFEYHRHDRPHQGLAGAVPIPRSVDSARCGRIVAEPRLGGLHHRYRRAA